jgi:hypothetical protein
VRLKTRAHSAQTGNTKWKFCPGRQTREGTRRNSRAGLQLFPIQKKKQEKAAAKKKIHQNNQARNYELPETSQIWESRKRDELHNSTSKEKFLD